jgi:hypothetical protein
MEYQPRLPWDEEGTTRRAPARGPRGPVGHRAGRGAKAAARGAAKAPRDGAKAPRVAATPAAAGGRKPRPAFVVDERWQLDDATRRAGRRGLAEARAALARAAARNGHAA